MNVGFVLAERVLYLPSLGFCLLVPAMCQRACAGSSTSDPQSAHSPRSDVSDDAGATNAANASNASDASNTSNTPTTATRKGSSNTQRPPRGNLGTADLRKESVGLRPSSLQAMALLIVVSLYSMKTITRNKDWLTQKDLYISGVAVRFIRCKIHVL